MSEVVLSSAQDFCRTDTATNIVERIFPALEDILRREFSVVTITGAEFGEDDVADIRFSEAKAQTLICGYIHSLADMHIQYGQLYAELAREDRCSCLHDGP